MCYALIQVRAPRSYNQGIIIMKKYRVIVSTTAFVEVAVEANSEDEANYQAESIVGKLAEADLVALPSFHLEEEYDYSAEIIRYDKNAE